MQANHTYTWWEMVWEQHISCSTIRSWLKTNPQIGGTHLLTLQQLSEKTICFSRRYFVRPEQSPASPTARASLPPAARTPRDDSQVSLYNENFVRTCFVSPEETQSSASPVARASLMPATHTPGDDSQVSGDSEPFVPAYFVSPEQNQTSILFRATPLRQQRRNDSERKEKRSECAFPCAFSCDCGMQLSCKPHTDKQTKPARTEVCVGAGT